MFATGSAFSQPEKQPLSHHTWIVICKTSPQFLAPTPNQPYMKEFILPSLAPNVEKRQPKWFKMSWIPPDCLFPVFKRRSDSNAANLLEEIDKRAEFGLSVFNGTLFDPLLWERTIAKNEIGERMTHFLWENHFLFADRDTSYSLSLDEYKDIHPMERGEISWSHFAGEIHLKVFQTELLNRKEFQRDGSAVLEVAQINGGLLDDWKIYLVLSKVEFRED